MIEVRELIYPDDEIPLPDEDVSEDVEGTEPFRPTGETIPIRLILPEITEARTRESIVIEFSTQDEQLERQMLDEVEALYSIYGTPILEAFVGSITASDPQPTLIRSRRLGMGQVPEEEEIASPPYAKLQTTFRRANNSLQQQIQKTLNRIQNAAQASAIARLEDSKKQILKEAQRYLSGATSDDKAIAILTASAGATTELSGPDAAKMLKAMLEIQELSDQIQATGENLERAFANDPSQPMTTIERTMTQQLEDAQNELISALAVNCEDYPILYRLVGQVRLPRDTTFQLQRGGVGNYVPKSTHGRDLLGSFKGAVYAELQNAWQAANALSKDIEEHGDLVWRYPNIVEQALLEQDIDSDSIDERAAEERMEQAQGASSASILATSAGIVEMTVVLAGAAPPIAVVVGILATLASIPELIEIYKNTQQQENAYRAVLNPNESLASDASYVSFMFGLVSLLPGFADLRRLGPIVKML